MVIQIKFNLDLYILRNYRPFFRTLWRYGLYGFCDLISEPSQDSSTMQQKARSNTNYGESLPPVRREVG